MESEIVTIPERPPDTSPLGLLHQLIEKGADPVALSKMMDLAERYEQARAQREFAVALVAAQFEMPVVVKATPNSRTGKMYANLEAVQKVIRPIYTKHGFSISWNQGVAPMEGYTRVLATLFHIGGFSKEFQGDYPLDGKGAKGGEVMNALQGTVSSHTYAQRDMTRLMFNLTIAETDTDGEGIDPLLSPDQVGIVNDLIGECQRVGKLKDLKRFWAWLQVDGLHAVTQSLFTKTVAELNRLRKEAK